MTYNEYTYVLLFDIGFMAIRVHIEVQGSRSTSIWAFIYFDSQSEFMPISDLH